MHKSILKFTLALFMVLTLSANALANNVAAFNSVEVMQQSAIAKAAQAEIQKKFGGEGEKLDKEFAAIQKEIADFQKQAPTLSESARNTKGQALEAKARSFEEKRATLTQNLNPFQQSINAQIQETLLTACANYAKANNLDIIMDSASIAYMATSANVTAGIIAEMDKVWKSKGSKFK